MGYIGASPISPTRGGTGVQNARTSTITLGGALTTVGAFTASFTMTGNTAVTFPTTGTLATTSQLPSLPVPVSQGGTGLSSLTNHALQVGAGTSNMTQLAVATTGQLLVGATGADPAFGSSATGDFTFTSATAGATRTLTVSNTNNSNTASNALSQITVGGTSAGDPFQTFTVTGATSWSHGIDNSASDSYKLSQSTALGTTDRVIVNTSGQSSIPITLNVGSSAAALETITAIQSGSSCQIGSRSTDNTSANSNAGFAAVTGGTSGGNPYFLWEPTGGTVADWSMAADYSGNLYISPSSNLTGAAKTFNWDSLGRTTNTVQPSFFFYLNGNTAANKTGDSTGYVLGTDALTQRSQQGSGMTTAGTFTVPVTGWYSFDVCAYIFGVGAHTSGYVLLQIGGTNTAFFCMVNPSNVANASGEMTLTGSIKINLTATNTITFLVTVGGSTKTIGIGGVSGSIYRTYVAGTLLH